MRAGDPRSSRRDAFDEPAESMIGSVPLLDGAVFIALWWVLIGAAGLIRARSIVLVARVLFPAGALGGVALAGLALLALWQPPQATVLPLGLPDLPFHLRLDALSSFFL